MKRVNYWKAVAFVTIVALLMALQPAVTFAYESLGHCGG